MEPGRRGGGCSKGSCGHRPGPVRRVPSPKARKLPGGPGARRVLDFPSGLIRVYAVSSWRYPSAHPSAPGSGPSPQHPSSAGSLRIPEPRAASGWLDSAAPSVARHSRVLSSGRWAELGRRRPRFRACPDCPIPITPAPPPRPEPGARRRSRPRVPPAVPEPAVAPEALPPLPPLTMGPGPRLLLPLVLCVGLSALVPPAGASGVRKRGPSVTAKVTGRRAAVSPRAGRGDGRALGTGTSGSGAARRGLPGRRGREAAGGLGGRRLPARGGPRSPGRLWGRWAPAAGCLNFAWELGEASGTGGPFLQEGDRRVLPSPWRGLGNRSRKNAGGTGTGGGDALRAEGLQLGRPPRVSPDLADPRSSPCRGGVGAGITWPC